MSYIWRFSLRWVPFYVELTPPRGHEIECPSPSLSQPLCACLPETLWSQVQLSCVWLKDGAILPWWKHAIPSTHVLKPCAIFFHHNFCYSAMGGDRCLRKELRRLRKLLRFFYKSSQCCGRAHVAWPARVKSCRSPAGSPSRREKRGEAVACRPAELHHTR